MAQIEKIKVGATTYDIVDTKNTTGATDTSDKIYLVGATTQGANPQTYTQDTAYVGADGCVYSNGEKTVTGDVEEATDIDIEDATEVDIEEATEIDIEEATPMALVTEITAQATDDEIPTAKAVYDTVDNFNGVYWVHYQGHIDPVTGEYVSDDYDPTNTSYDDVAAVVAEGKLLPVIDYGAHWFIYRSKLTNSNYRPGDPTSPSEFKYTFITTERRGTLTASVEKLADGRTHWEHRHYDFYYTAEYNSATYQDVTQMLDESRYTVARRNNQYYQFRLKDSSGKYQFWAVDSDKKLKRLLLWPPDTTYADGHWTSTEVDLGGTSLPDPSGLVNGTALLVQDGQWSANAITNVSLGQGYSYSGTETGTTRNANLAGYTLTTGGIVAIRFRYDVPANARLNINQTGAKYIYWKNAAIPANIIKADDTATFMYDGTYYRLLCVDNLSGVPSQSVTLTIPTSARAYYNYDSGMSAGAYFKAWGNNNWTSSYLSGDGGSEQISSTEVTVTGLNQFGVYLDNGGGNDSMTFYSDVGGVITVYLNDGTGILEEYYDEETGNTFTVLPKSKFGMASSITLNRIDIQSACVSGDTEVLCAGGDHILFKDLKEGDYVLAMNPSNMRLEEVPVTKVGHPESNKPTEVFTFEDGTQIKAIGNHRFYHKETNSMQYIQDFAIGDHTVNSKRQYVALVSKETLGDAEPRQVYFLHNKYHNYFCNGLMSGDRATGLMHFEDKEVNQ